MANESMFSINSEFIKSLNMSSNRKMLEELLSRSDSGDDETTSLAQSREQLDSFERKQIRRDKKTQKQREDNVKEMRKFHERILME